MTDAHQTRTDSRASRPLLRSQNSPLMVMAVAAVSAPLVLAGLRFVEFGPALLAASCLTLLASGMLIWLRASQSVAGFDAGVQAAPAPESRFATDRSPPFELILERFEDPVLLVTGGNRDDPGARRFVFANAAARTLLRIQRLEGPLSTAIRAPEVLAAVDRALFEALPTETAYQSGGVQDRVWRARAAPLDPSARAEAQADGPRAVLTLRDETESRRSERTRADFLANASHELRTPLASLTGFIETLQGHARNDPVARESFLAIMYSQADRMRRLIEDLMSLSRIELAEHIRPSGTVDLSVAVVDVVDALEPLAKEKNVTFNRQSPPPGVALTPGDRDQILQVIQNLIENALKYSVLGGVVEVDVLTAMTASEASKPSANAGAHLSLLTPDHAEDQVYVVLRVRDHGPGIARSFLPRLTERFYRVEGQKSGEHAGTGLGLAIVKHIVNRHHGGLIVESTEGRGASFTAYFPAVAERDLTAPI